MRDFFRRFWQKLNAPKTWFLIAWYALTLTAIVGALLILFVEYQGTFLEYVAYGLFALAAVSLTYTVYTLVKFMPALKRGVIRILEGNALTREMMRNYGYRTVVFAIGTFGMSVLFSAFNAYLGISSKSIWYGALAAYYILLALLRGGILAHHNTRRKGKMDNQAMQAAKTYRTCGWLLLVLNTALSSAIAQMIFDDQFFTYADWTVFAFAAYAFFKISMSIYNFFKARKQDNLTVEAIRNINLTDAAVSILALQTALLHTFQTGKVDVSAFNTLTGIAVSAVAFALGIYMVIKGNKEVRKEKENGKQTL